jgi:hypothetical protein
MFRLSRRTMLAVILAGPVLAGCAATDKITQTTPVAPVNAEKGIALKGYDAVAYFTKQAPIAGSAAFTHRWGNATWQFASAENRDAFAADPERYAPQYGGYCAFALSRGFIADIDPDSWAVEGGRLYLNNNGFAHTLWNQDRPGNIAVADRNWPHIPKLAEPKG